MFYSDRMALSEIEALEACRELINSMSLLGGALTLNWHTRSLSPERLWGDFYARLLNELRTRHVCFGTAGEIVEWFRRRRALCFESVDFEDTGVRVVLNSPNGHSEPFSFTLRIHTPKFVSGESRFRVSTPKRTDDLWSGEKVLEIPY